MGGLITAAVVSTAAGAYAANKQAKAQKKAAEAANKPQTTTQEPWAGSLNMLNRAAKDIPRYYDERLAAGPGEYVPMPTYGGSGQNFRGASGDLRQLAGAARDRALGPNELLNSGSDALRNFAGGNANPLLRGAYDKADRASNRNMQRLIDRGFEGKSRTMDAAQDYYAAMMGDPEPPRDYGSSGSSRGRSRSAQAAHNAAVGSGRGKMGAAVDKALLEFIEGGYLNEGNPHFAKVEETLRRQAARTRAEQRGVINSQAGDQYGGGSWAAAQAQADALQSSQLDDRLGQMAYDDYVTQQRLLLEAAGLADNSEQWQASDATARAGIGASAASARDNIDAQLQMARWANAGNALDVMGGYETSANAQLGGNINNQMAYDQGNLEIMARLGGQASTDQLGAINMIPGMDQGYYNAFNNASGLFGNIDELDARAASDAAADARAQYEGRVNEWANKQAYDQQVRDWNWNVSNDFLNAALRLGNAGGATTAPGANLPIPSTGAATLAGAAGGFMSGYAGGRNAGMTWGR